MKKLIKKFIYFALSLQEKALSAKLQGNFSGSYSNKSSKTFISGTEHLTLTSETEKNKEVVKQNVQDIVKNCENNPQKLLEYIESTGTKVLKMKTANKLLKAINEEEGLICELKGFKALYINLYTNSGFSFKTKPMFIIGDGNIEPLCMIHHFHKWYSLKMGLPGFDYKSQQNFKKYLKNINDKDLTTLSLNDTLSLQEAVARDKEATDFCLEIARKTEGAKNVQKKMTNGGANI